MYYLGECYMLGLGLPRGPRCGRALVPLGRGVTLDAELAATWRGLAEVPSHSAIADNLDRILKLNSLYSRPERGTN